MCNANPHQQTILISINTYTTDYIVNFLTLHNFELSCMLKYGISPEKLNELDIELIRERVEKENISKEQMLEAGLTRTKIDKIFSPGGDDPVSSVSCPICEMTFESQEDYISYKKSCSTCNVVPSNEKYNWINNNDARANARMIRKWLRDGEITKEGLNSQCGIDYNLSERLENFYNGQMKEMEVSNLPNLKDGRTDFYFLGMPAAGKSCLVASLLSYWEHVGIYNPDVSNPRSLEYTSVLLEPFDLGYLPDRTESGFIDYINGELQVRIKRRWGGDVTRYIPINILDMAGEAWRQAAEEGSGLPQHKKYLDNKNDKAILIVIDCSEPDSTKKQSRNIVRIFQYFTEWGIWDKTDSVAVVITKADKLTDSTDYNALKLSAERFYNSSACMNLKNRIDELARTHRFELSILPYSIGECRFGQLLLNYSFETNHLMEESTRNLSEWIVTNTGGLDGGSLGSIFSN